MKWVWLLVLLGCGSESPRFDLVNHTPHMSWCDHVYDPVECGDAGEDSAAPGCPPGVPCDHMIDAGYEFEPRD